jgi:TRAP-type C4-dicarboxylate transport system permease small subunit
MHESAAPQGNSRVRPENPAPPLAWLSALRTSIERLGEGMGDAAGWVYVGGALLISFDALSRKFLGFSSQGTTEITGYMLGFGITWGLTHAFAMKAHIRVDVLVTRLPLWIRTYLHALALALLSFVGFFFVWRGWAVVLESWEFGAKDTSALSIPLIVPQALWAVGLTAFFASTAVALLEVLLLLVLGCRDGVDRLLGPRSIVEETEEVLEAAGLVESPPLSSSARHSSGPQAGTSP